MTDIATFLNAMSDMARADRSKYHMTLGQAIDALRAMPPDLPVHVDIGGSVHGVGSYRGYYADLALEPESEPIAAADLLARLQAAEGDTFTGYKGGAFVMGADTPLWVAGYGDATGIAVMGISTTGTAATIHTKKID